MRSVNGKVTTNLITADEWNDFSTESQTLITTTGIALSAGDLTQLAQAVSIYATGAQYFIDSGAADAYVLTVAGSLEKPPAYFDGMTITFRPGNANTGASTVNAGGIGVVDIKRDSGAALVENDLLSSRDAVIRYSAAAGDFFLASYTLGNNNSPRGYMDGLITSLDVGDVQHDVEIGIGICRDSTNTVDMILNAALTKRVDTGSWAQGDNLGGLPAAATLSVDTWYHLFLIAKTDGTVDAGWDTSLTATNLLAEASAYTYYRRVWSNMTNASSNWLPYFQHGGECVWDENGAEATVQKQVSFTDPGTGAILADVEWVPLGIRTRADLAFVYKNVDLTTMKVGSGDDPINLTSDDPFGHASAGPAASLDYMSLNARLMTNLVSEISHDVSNSVAASRLTISVRGYEDFRGANGMN